MSYFSKYRRRSSEVDEEKDEAKPKPSLSWRMRVNSLMLDDDDVTPLATQDTDKKRRTSLYTDTRRDSLYTDKSSDSLNTDKRRTSLYTDKTHQKENVPVSPLSAHARTPGSSSSPGGAYSRSSAGSFSRGDIVRDAYGGTGGSELERKRERFTRTRSEGYLKPSLPYNSDSRHSLRTRVKAADMVGSRAEELISRYSSRRVDPVVHNRTGDGYSSQDRTLGSYKTDHSRSSHESFSRFSGPG